MYPVELEINDREHDMTSIYDKRDNFNFHTTNFPFLGSNIPTSLAYVVFISQLIRYARACFSYGCFILRAMRLSNKLLEQGYVKERLKSSLKKFYGRYVTSIYDKRYDFNFHTTNFPFLSSNIPTSPAYVVFISQLIRNARACSSYVCYILRAMRLSKKLLEQGYVKERLKSSLKKFYGRYGDLIKQYEVPSHKC